MLQDAPGSFCLLIGIPDKNAAEKTVHKYKDGVCILNVLLYHVKEPFSSENGSFSYFLGCLEERRFFLGVYLVFIAFQAGACAPAFFVPFFRISFKISSRVSAAAASALWIA